MTLQLLRLFSLPVLFLIDTGDSISSSIYDNNLRPVGARDLNRAGYRLPWRTEFRRRISASSNFFCRKNFVVLLVSDEMSARFIPSGGGS